MNNQNGSIKVTSLVSKRHFSSVMTLLAVVLGGMNEIQASEPSKTLDVEIFNHGPLVVQPHEGVRITVINLLESDDVNNSAPEFAYDPNDPNAEQAVKSNVIAWMQSPAGAAHKARLHAAWRGVQRMFNCGIQKVPAIAFDNCEYVIYGTTNVKRAMQDYSDFMAQQPVGR